MQSLVGQTSVSTAVSPQHCARQCQTSGSIGKVILLSRLPKFHQWAQQKQRDNKVCININLPLKLFATETNTSQFWAPWQLYHQWHACNPCDQLDCWFKAAIWMSGYMYARVKNAKNKNTWGHRSTCHYRRQAHVLILFLLFSLADVVPVFPDAMCFWQSNGRQKYSFRTSKQVQLAAHSKVYSDFSEYKF